MGERERGRERVWVSVGEWVSVEESECGRENVGERECGRERVCERQCERALERDCESVGQRAWDRENVGQRECWKARAWERASAWERDRLGESESMGEISAFCQNPIRNSYINFQYFNKSNHQLLIAFLFFFQMNQLDCRIY